MKYLPLEERREKAEALIELTGAKMPGTLMMTSEQLKEAANTGFDIGAHTVNHPILKTLSDQKAAEEIAESRNILQGVLDRPIDLFAYPNGVPGTDYSARDAKLVADIGFKAAVSTQPGYSSSETNRYELRRFTPWDKRPATFLGRLLKNYSGS
jgi:peptidoglycan/xylan/chitin deacetylase (PgdA/CDA1 family)